MSESSQGMNNAFNIIYHMTFVASEQAPSQWFMGVTVQDSKRATKLHFQTAVTRNLLLLGACTALLNLCPRTEKKVSRRNTFQLQCGKYVAFLYLKKKIILAPSRDQHCSPVVRWDRRKEYLRTDEEVICLSLDITAHW